MRNCAPAAMPTIAAGARAATSAMTAPASIVVRDAAPITGRIVAISAQIENDEDVPLRQYDKILFHPKNAIPVELRPLIGNRIYGCDDCQTACPWNKFAQRAVLPDFDERHGLGHASLVELFAWSEEEFNRKMEGSPIRRIGHERWLRNLAVGLGNAAAAGARGDAAIVSALLARRDDPSPLVREHVEWALDCHSV